VSPLARLLIITVLLLAPGEAALAQDITPVPPPRATPGAPVVAEDPDALEPGDMRVRAESYEQVAPGQWEARGFVDLRVWAMRIQADRTDVFEEEQPDGTVSRRLVAEGNVVFLRGGERLAGDRLEMDDSGRGFMENAIGYVEPGVFVEGRRVERVDDETYKVEGGRFTSCAQPNPRWEFTASSARIHVDDKIIARNALLKVKSVPTFYLPYMYYPIGSEGRTTGFLFPHFGYSSTRGFTIGSGFFWAMGRSWDQTFSVDYYDKIGTGFGHELRYLSHRPSRGTFRTYMIRVKDSNELDWDIDWRGIQMLPAGVRATVNVRQFSNLLFNSRFQESFNRITSRTQRWSGSLDKDLRLATLSLKADRVTTFFGVDSNRVNSHLPSLILRRFPRQVGWGGVVFGINASAERLERGTQELRDQWARFDVAPTFSRPLRLSFLEVNPEVGYRWTRYGTSFDVDENEESGLFGDPLNRSFWEARVGVRGPIFSKVFNTPGFGYSDKFKHTIGPELTWTYRTRVEDFNSIPKFDGRDYYLGTNQIAYALVQKFYSKRRGPGGRKVPYEFLSWRIQQTYYVQIADGQSNFDPNYSSSAFGPGLRPEHLSPLLSRLRFRPTRNFSLNFQVEYDVNFDQIRRTSTYGNFNSRRVSFNGGWSRSVRLSEDPEERIVGSESLRGNAGFEVVPNRFFVDGSASYDLKNKILWQLTGRLRYQIQCCGFVVEHNRFNWNGREEKQWRFNLELANIGSIGNFLGQDSIGGSRQGLGGFR
jgi:LPS-assembly protein